MSTPDTPACPPDSPLPAAADVAPRITSYYGHKAGDHVRLPVRIEHVDQGGAHAWVSWEHLYRARIVLSSSVRVPLDLLEADPPLPPAKDTRRADRSMRRSFIQGDPVVGWARVPMRVESVDRRRALVVCSWVDFDGVRHEGYFREWSLSGAP